MVKIPSFTTDRFRTGRRIPPVPLLLAIVLAGIGVGTISLSRAATNQSNMAALDGETETIIVQYKKGHDSASLAGTVAKTPIREKRHFKRLGVKSVKVPKGQRDKVIQELAKDPTVASVESDAVVHLAAVPSDPNYSMQWHWPKIAMPTVWDAATGSTSTVVAVVDSGVNADHIDLAGQLLTGYNAIDGSTNVADSLGHGSLVAGLVAGANNDAGIVGGCWKCKVLPIKVTTLESGSLEALLAGIEYALTQNVDVINVSMVTPDNSPAMQAAVETAANQNVMVVAAAGNNGNSVIQYPAGFPSVLSVGGTTTDDTPVDDSNYGTWVDIAAPGTNVVSSYIPSNMLGAGHGTSFAAPIVASLVALMKDKYPTATLAQITTAITTTGDACCSGKFVNGRLNAANAMAKLQSLVSQPAPDTTKPTVGFTAPAAGATVSSAVPVAVTATDNVGVTKVELRIGNTLAATDTAAPYNFSWDSTKLPNGSLTLTAIAYDAANNQATASRTVTVSNGGTNPNPTPTGKVGDLNKDNQVNLVDLSIMLTSWNTANATADLNGSGRVDLVDLSMLLSNWNK